MTSSSTNANATVAQRIAAAFRRHGAATTFGQSIPTPFHLVALEFGIRQAMYRTENAGGAMADGYARISGRIGIVTAQNGPALGWPTLLEQRANVLTALVKPPKLKDHVMHGSPSARQTIDGRSRMPAQRRDLRLASA